MMEHDEFDEIERGERDAMESIRARRKAHVETTGERLKRLRLAKGLSQRDLSSPGVSYAYISRIEAGARTPSVKAIRKLAEKLEVHPDYLERGIEPVVIEGWGGDGAFFDALVERVREHTGNGYMKVTIEKFDHA